MQRSLIISVDNFLYIAWGFYKESFFVLINYHEFIKERSPQTLNHHNKNLSFLIITKKKAFKPTIFNDLSTFYSWYICTKRESQFLYIKCFRHRLVLFIIFCIPFNSFYSSLMNLYHLIYGRKEQKRLNALQLFRYDEFVCVFKTFLKKK